MVIPLTLAIAVMALIIVMMAVVLYKQQQRIAQLTAEQVEQVRGFGQMLMDQTDYAMKTAIKIAEKSPENTHAVVEAVQGAVRGITEAVADGMRSVYAPMTQNGNADREAMMGDVATPWYGGERGGMDFSDPTDFVGGLRADPAGFDGAVIDENDPEPFGIPGLGIDPAVPSGGA